jgi:UDP-glucose 4-epimerase
MTEISVIGATSPLGTHAVRDLVFAGHSVAATFRQPDLVPEAWRADPAITCFELDLMGDLPSDVFSSESIVWLAHIDAGRFNEKEIEINLSAFNRFLSVLDLSVTKQIVFVSSGGSVYGHADTLPISEGDKREPLSTYGKTKRELEDRLIEFGRTTGLKTAILRPGNIYGFERPDRKSKGVTAAFLRSIVDGSPFTLIHGGRTIRDFIHVDDVSRAIVSAIETDRSEVVWNVGTGVGSSTIEVLELILRQTGKEMPELIERENFSSDVLANILDVGRIKKEANWAAEIGLAEGIERALRFWNFEGRAAGSND